MIAIVALLGIGWTVGIGCVAAFAFFGATQSVALLGGMFTGLCTIAAMIVTIIGAVSARKRAQASANSSLTTPTR